MKPLISLVSIVKNEETILERMINSVKDIVDEFVICDTGSTDGTKNIISKYQTVIEIPFVNYVETKNAALKKATGEYILFMDADEVLYQGAEVLKEWAQGKNFEALSCKITEGPRDYNIISMEYERVRMWRNDRNWKFEGPGVHEAIVFNNNIVFDGRVKVRHDHFEKSAENTNVKKFEFWKQLLFEHLKKEPGNARALFYLARTQRDLGENLSAIDTYKKYLDVPNNNFVDERWQASYDIATIYKGLGEYDKMFEYCDLSEYLDSRRCEHLNLKAGVYFSQYKYDDAIPLYELAISRTIPSDVRLFLNPIEYTLNGKDKLVLSYYKNKQYDKAEKVCLELSQSLKNYDRRVLNNLWWCRTRINMNIFLTLGNTPEPIWGGIFETQGVHGVETTYIELAKGLQNLGHNIFLFCNTEKFHAYNGVNYIPFSEYASYTNLNPDVVITSRWFDSFTNVVGKKILWLQDASPIERNYDFNKVDEVIVSSQWHADYLTTLVGERMPKGKLKIIPLGVDKSLFKKERKKDKYKVLYSSNPNRGLDILGDMWGEITERIPQIKLNVLYGWNGLKTWRTDDVWKADIEKEQAEILEKFRPYENVDFMGRLTKQELAEEMLSSSFLLYSCAFFETYCLSCLEAQIAGMIVITSDLGALHTTVNDYGNRKIVGDPKSTEYKKIFIDSLVALINDNKEMELCSNYNRVKTLSSNCDWSDISLEWQKNLWEILD